MSSKKPTPPPARHVVPRGDDKWAVQRAGGERASSLHETQADAMREAQRQASQEGGQMVVHRPDGRIREERTYREDPYQPKG